MICEKCQSEMKKVVNKTIFRCGNCKNKQYLIRTCPICHKQFKAKRIDSVCCCNYCSQRNWELCNPERSLNRKRKYELNHRKASRMRYNQRISAIIEKELLN